MVNSVPDGYFARKKTGRLVGSRLGQDGGLAFDIYDSTDDIDMDNVDEGDVYLVDGEEGLAFYGYDGDEWVEL